MKIAKTLEMNVIPVELKQARLSVSFFYFALGLCFATWASRIPILKSGLGLSEAELGTILLMLPAGQLLTMPLAAALVNRLGSKLVLPIAGMAYAILLIFIGLSSNAWWLGGALFVYGIASNISNIAINTQGVLVEEQYGKSIMSSFHGAWSLGGFAGSLIGLLTLNLQLSSIMHFAIIFVLLIGLILINKRFLILDAKTNKAKEKKEKFKPDSIIVQLGIIGFFSMATEGAMFDWSGVYFSDVIHAPLEWITIGFTSFMIMMASGRFIGDWIIEKFGRKRTLQASGLLMFTGMMASVLFPNFYVGIVSFMLVGLGVACNVPTVYSLTGRHERIPAGVAIAMVSSISFMGFLVGPPLIGYVAELFNLQYSFALFSLFGLCMFIMTSKLKFFAKL
ncbi:MFS transporter [Sphingobacterium sp. HJSM2_6]|uniref:MFS transporter n=1 Tax=Sphingobacterium sp. HJSM2_6 TaxID=3366264 RepID=UPI003BD7C656